MGHSMGCVTAAMAALDPSLPPKDTSLILVAPALAAPRNKKADAGGAEKQGLGVVANSRKGVGEVEEAELRGGGQTGGGVLSNLGQSLAPVAKVPLKGLVKGLGSIGKAAAWLFNWCILPLAYPIEIVLLR